MIERGESGSWSRFPRLNLSYGPTPIEELARLRAALGGGPRILIKRDDYLGPGFGGNKVRKLEYLLAAAREDGAEVVITCGGVKSNHARVTAALRADWDRVCAGAQSGGGKSAGAGSRRVCLRIGSTGRRST
jgi:1-aminocyclopropane-1-carboxylate deaminase/D-cysteine desulfhydrase-like pyridoxal-dependent ACC family enzyme